jgi:hypothetical protein
MVNLNKNGLVIIQHAKELNALMNNKYCQTRLKQDEIKITILLKRDRCSI